MQIVLADVTTIWRDTQWWTHCQYKNCAVDGEDKYLTWMQFQCKGPELSPLASVRVCWIGKTGYLFGQNVSIFPECYLIEVLVYAKHHLLA